MDNKESPNSSPGLLGSIDDGPPCYSEAPVPSQSNSRRPLFMQPANVNFYAYAMPSSVLSEDSLVLTLTLSSLTFNPKKLLALVQEQVALPPRPLVRITGQHSEYGEEWGSWAGNKVDFDLTLDMMATLGDQSALHIEKPNHQDMNIDEKKTHLAENTLNDLGDVVEAFCGSVIEPKSLTIAREIANWDTNYLDSLIRAAIASTKYQGQLTVSFPITYGKVVIQSGMAFQPSSSSPSKWFRKIGGKKESESTAPAYEEIVRVVWPYANVRMGVEGRVCAVQTEVEWWDVWRDAVKNAALKGKVGYVTASDWMDVVMGAGEGEKTEAWGLRER